MPVVTIRPYQEQDEAAIEEIVYRTGYNGEDLTGLNYIDDKRLFFLIFAAYYVWHEPQHCFVAVDTDTNKVVGYIFGTTDTAAQEARSARLMNWRIYLHAFLVTSWRYPQTFRTLWQMRKMEPESKGNNANDVVAKYPAHLHINVLPEYHGRGIGSQLIKRFEEHLIRLGVRGVHLETSNYNHKALPFYKKMGYTTMRELKLKSHPKLADFTVVFFAKTF